MNIQQIDRYCDLYERRLKRGEELSPTQFLREQDISLEMDLLAELETLRKDYGAAHADGATSNGRRPAFNLRSGLRNGGDGSPAIGDYEIIEEIARGGMGVVYKAHQRSLNRTVALKMIRSGELADPQEIARLRAEAEAAARLDHPGIVPVYEVNWHNGEHYLSMAFVEGGSLADRMADGPLPAREAARLVRETAAAVQFAHERDVIHRDIKPANILLDGEGRPRVSDFGLAKSLSRRSGLTVTGQVVGTPAYMPPEQARGGPAGRLADVYSLGATFYCLLAGRPPFQAATIHETLQQVIERDPLPLRSLNPGIPGDLETICLKCLAKDPPRRYASAGALAEDLDAWLCGKPIKARPVSALEKGIKWARRRPAAVGFLGASVIAVAAVVGLAVGAPLYLSEQQARADADAAEATVKRQLQNTERLHYRDRLFRANQYWRDGRLDPARQSLANCDNRFRGWEWYLLYRLFWQERDNEPAVRTINTDDVTALINQFACTTGNTIFTADSDGIIRLRSLDGSSRPEVFARVGDSGFLMAVSEDAAQIAAAAAVKVADGQRQQSTIIVWNTSSHDEIFRRTLPGSVNTLALSGDGARLAAGVLAEDREGVLVWELNGSREPWLIGQALEQIVFHPSGHRVAGISASAPGRMKRIAVWEVGPGERVQQAWEKTLDSQAFVVVFSPDEVHLLVGQAQSVSVRDAETGGWLADLSGNRGSIRQLVFSPDGTRLMAPDSGGTIAVWDWEHVSRIRALPGEYNEGVYKYLRSWSGTPNEVIVIVSAERAQTGVADTSIAFSRDGSRIVSLSSDRILRVWNGSPSSKFLAVGVGPSTGRVHATDN